MAPSGADYAIRADLVATEARIYRALRIQAAAIVGIAGFGLGALRFLG